MSRRTPKGMKTLGAPASSRQRASRMLAVPAIFRGEYVEIKFYDDPQKRGRPKEQVRINRLGLYVYEDRRRVAVGFDITPFQERPSIDVTISNADGITAGTMHIVDIVENNFTLTLHLRDEEPTDQYRLTAVLYYATPETERLDIDRKTASFDLRIIGRQ